MKSRARGFTLFELMLAIVGLGIVTLIIVGSVVGILYCAHRIEPDCPTVECPEE